MQAKPISFSALKTQNWATLKQLPLLSALKTQNWVTFKQLLTSGANLAQIDEQGIGIIHHLVKLVSLEQLVDLLAIQSPEKQQRLLNQLDAKGQTVLHHAAEASRVELIPWLVQQGLSVNAQDQYGYTPLHQATKSSEFEETLDALLTYGPDLLLSNQNGDTALQYALGMGLIDTTMHLTRVLLSQLTLPQSSHFALLGLFETFYLSFTREEKPNFKEFRRNQLQQSYDKCMDACQKTRAQDPVFPLLLFLLSEIALTQETYTHAMVYATAGYLLAQARTQLLLDNQRRRVLIQFRQTVFKQMDRLSFPTFPTSVCGLPANQPLEWNTLLHRLKAHRAELKQNLNALPFPQVLKQNNQFFKELSQTMFKLALGLANPPNIPPYSFLTLGSLSQDEMAPYSDLEFALLITDPQHRRFFAPIIDCMELLVIGLGETPCALPGHTELLPTGYHFDPGGNTPKFPEFLTTPEELAAHQLERDEVTAIRRQALRNASFLMGDPRLFDQYQIALRQALKQTAQPEARALFQNALQEFSLSGQTQTLTVKKSLYRLPSQILNGLCLYHGLFATGSLERINVLLEKKILSSVNARVLTELLEVVLKLRFQTHLHYGTEEETFYHPDKADLAQFERPYVLKRVFIHQHLFQIYAILFELELGLKQVLDGKTRYFYNTSILPNLVSWTDYLQARIHERILPEKALGFYQSALQVSPKDWPLQLAYQTYLEHTQRSLETQQTAVCQTGKTFTLELIQILQTLHIPPTDYASRYYSIPDTWKADFVNALENHPDRDILQESFDRELKPFNWSEHLKLKGPEWTYQRLTALKSAQLETLSKRYQGALSTAEPPEKAVLLLSLLPVLAQRLVLLEKSLQEQQALSQNAVRANLRNLLQHEKQLPRYLQLYRQMPSSRRTLFRQQLAELGQPDPAFLEKLLKALHQEPDAAGVRPLWEQQKIHWKRLLQALLTSTPGKETTYNLDSPLLGGRFVLKPDIVKQVLDEQGEFRSTDFQGVKHNVVRLTLTLSPQETRTLYLKAYPEMPGMTYLIEQLHQHLIGHGTCLSELVKLERPQKEPIPVLISEEISGPTLHDVLKEAPDQLLQLNPRKFTELIWLAILTNPEDGLPTNYIFHTPPGEAPTLISIDHDHAFFPPFAWEAKKARLAGVAEEEEKSDDDEAPESQADLRWQLQVKTILFCLDALQSPLNEDARKAFLRLNPQTVLTTVLQNAQIQNTYYEKLFSPDEIQHFHQSQNSIFRPFQEKRLQCTIPIPLKEGDTILLYQKWMKLRQFLTRHPKATLLQCLLQVEPRVGLFYAKAFEDYDNPLERLLNLGRYPTNPQGQMVTKSRAAETLRLQSQQINQEAYAHLQDLTPAQGLAELEQMVRDAPLLDSIRAEVQTGNFTRFLSLKAPFHKAWVISGPPDNPEAAIDWRRLSEKQQQELLQHLIGVPFERLKLGDCSQLNLNILQKILNTSPELQELDLSGHPAVVETWFIQIIPLLKSLRTCILNNLPNLKHLRNSQTSLPHLEWLVVSHNPQLQTLSLKAPQLKFLQARNNPQLKTLQTGSHVLREADLRGNPQLTRQGIEKSLASTQGLSQLQRLQCKDSGIQDPLLEDYPMLLIQSQNSDGYQETEALLRQYLGANWRDHPPTPDQKRRLGKLMEWGFRQNPRDGEGFLKGIIEDLKNGNEAVRNAASTRLLQTFQEANPAERERILTTLLMFARDNEESVRRAAAQALGEVFKGTSPAERDRILPTLLTLAEDANSDVRRGVAIAIVKVFKVGSSEEQARILPALVKLQEDKDEDVFKDTVSTLGEVFEDANPQERARMLLALKMDEEWDLLRGMIEGMAAVLKLYNPQERARFLSICRYRDCDALRGAVEALEEAFKLANSEGYTHLFSRLSKFAGDEYSDVRSFTAFVLGKAFKYANLEEQARLLSMVFKLAGDENWRVRMSVVDALVEAFKCSNKQDRARLLSTLMPLTGDGNLDVRHVTAQALREAFKYANLEEQARLLSMLFKLAADENWHVRMAAAKALHSLGLTIFPPSTAWGLLKAFSGWAKSRKQTVRQTLAKGLLGWVLGENAGVLLSELVTLLRSLMQDSDKDVRDSAQKAFLELQVRFNLERTLQEIARGREAQLKSQQPFVPPSLVGRRTVLPPVTVDLSLPEALQQPVQVFEQQMQEKDLQVKGVLDKLLVSLPSGLQVLSQTLAGQHEVVLRDHLQYQGDILERFQSEVLPLLQKQAPGDVIQGLEQTYRAEQAKAKKALVQQEAQLLKTLEQKLNQLPGIDMDSILRLQALFFEQQQRFQRERLAQEKALWETWRQVVQPKTLEVSLPSALEQRLARLEAQQKTLIQFFAGQQRLQDEQVALKAQAQLCTFYVTLRCKLEEIFLAFKIVTIGWLGEEDKKDYLTQGIRLAGDFVPLPVFKPMVKVLELSVQQKIERSLQPQRHTQWVVGVIEMAQLVETLARQLTWRYELQIKALSLEGVEFLADCAVMRMVEGIREERAKHPDTLVKEFILSVTQTSRLPEKALPRLAPDKKPWTQHAIFCHPGIVVYQKDKAHFYRGTTPQDAEKVTEFGYRLGTVEEARALGWSELKLEEHRLLLPEGREALRFLFPSRSRSPSPPRREEPLRNFVNPLEARQKVSYQSPRGETQWFEVGWAAGTRQNNCFFHSLLQLKEQRPVRGLSASEEREVQIWADGLRKQLRIAPGRAIEIDQGEVNPEAEAIVRQMGVNVTVYVQTVRQELVFVKELEGAPGVKAKSALVNTGRGHYVPLWPVLSLGSQTSPSQSSHRRLSQQSGSSSSQFLPSLARGNSPARPLLLVPSTLPNRNRKGLFREGNPKHQAAKAWFQTRLDSQGLVMGSAFDDGDCFFDAMAQALATIGIKQKEGKPYTDKLLRKICSQSAQSLNRPGFENWIEEKVTQDQVSGQTYRYYLENIDKNAPEIGAGVIWGRPHIEGRILSERFQIRLHLQEIFYVEGELTLEHRLTDHKQTVTISEQEAYAIRERIIRLANYEGAQHYVPLIEKRL